MAITSIDVSYSGLYTIPEMAARTTVKELNAAGNRIYVLWEESIPPAIQDLNLEDNCLGSDGLIDWPSSLVKLNLSKNPFTSVDQSFFSANFLLQELNLSNTNLRGIDVLPPNLRILNVSNTDIEVIPTLPASMVRIEARNTRLQSIQPLPPNLEYADFSSNNLRSGNLPSSWGKSLKTLILSRNKLTHWLKKLPPTLVTLNLARNSLTEIGVVPENLQLLNIRMNKLYSVPESLLKRKGLLLILSGNCIATDIVGPGVLAAESQWNEPIHRATVMRIIGLWRRARLRKRLRALRRNGILRDELFALAMHPDRAGSFENVSVQWTR